MLIGCIFSPSSTQMRLFVASLTTVHGMRNLQIHTCGTVAHRRNLR